MKEIDDLVNDLIMAARSVGESHGESVDADREENESVQAVLDRFAELEAENKALKAQIWYKYQPAPEKEVTD